MKHKELKSLLGEYLYTKKLITNQEVLYYKNGTEFRSYNTFIGAKIGEQYYFSGWHDYSRTTEKWCKAWCGITKSQRNAMIKSGKAIYIED